MKEAIHEVINFISSNISYNKEFVKFNSIIILKNEIIDSVREQISNEDIIEYSIKFLDITGVKKYCVSIDSVLILKFSEISLSNGSYSFLGSFNATNINGNFNLLLNEESDSIKVSDESFIFYCSIGNDN